MTSSHPILVSATLGYIGPGAGFALSGAGFMIAGTLGVVLLAIAFLPARLIVRLVRRRRGNPRPDVERVVVVGLDGLDPRRCARLISEGRLRNLAALANTGYFSRLATTEPPLSPVAWSSFLTGVNPAKHGIFDFLAKGRFRNTPIFSLAHVETDDSGDTVFRSLRKSRPFWDHLGHAGVFSVIMRLPGTFPPEPLRGLLLSGQGVPDLRGTQGTGTVISEEAAPPGARSIHWVKANRQGSSIHATLPGPVLSGEKSHLPVTIVPDAAEHAATVNIGNTVLRVQTGRFSDWTPIVFRHGRSKARGIVKVLLIADAPDCRLYITPIHAAPRCPPFPLSHPRWYATYLAMLHGPFGTLGLAEDTAAFEAGILDNSAFIAQARDLQEERERIFLETLRKTRGGLVVGLFDLADRLQHMFMEPGSGIKGGADSATINDAYERLDALVGQIMTCCGDKTVLFAVSDHGFTHIRRLVHVNAWLRDAGYLGLKDPAAKGDFLENIDWPATRAYGLGLSGIHLNIKGRQPQGMVDPARRESLAREIAARLEALVDPETGESAVLYVRLTRDIHQGPYLEEGPDLIVGWREGYRTAWDSATGGATGPVFANNTRKWSGDHAVAADLVPGVLFCNRPLRIEAGRVPHIMDMAPTILAIFGIDPPSYMDGAAMEVGRTPAKGEAW